MITNKILASLIPMLTVQSLSKPEYKAFFATIYSYLKKIEDAQAQVKLLPRKELTFEIEICRNV